MKCILDYSSIQNEVFYARLTGRSVIMLAIHGGIISSACYESFKRVFPGCKLRFIVNSCLYKKFNHHKNNVLNCAHRIE